MATNPPHFGPGAGFTFLDNVGCTGNETNLTQCRHNGLGVHDCLPSQDAGVFCNSGKCEGYRAYHPINFCTCMLLNTHITITSCICT